MYVTLAGEPLLAYLLASVRIVAWLVVVPPFSTRAVPTVTPRGASVCCSNSNLAGTRTGRTPVRRASRLNSNGAANARTENRQ